MSIQILTTMQWSRLCWNESFKAIISLDDILPQVGKQYPVMFDKDEHYTNDAEVLILWKPPHSELNGWHDKRPSDILRSYVLKGHLTVFNLETRFEIVDCVSLTDYFSQVSKSSNAPTYLTAMFENSLTITPYDVSHIIKAKVLDFCYLMFTQPELTCELILSFQQNKLTLHYFSHYHPCYDHTEITNYEMNESEQYLFKRLIGFAKDISENSNQALENNQVFGAEYW